MNGQEVESLTGIGILGAVLIGLFILFWILGIAPVHDKQEEIREEARRENKIPIEMNNPVRVAAELSLWAIVLGIGAVLFLASLIDTHVPLLPKG